MKIITLLLPFMALTLSVSAQVIPYQELSRPADKPGTDLFVYYSTPSDEVTIKNGKISHRSKFGGSGGYEEVGRQTVAEAVPLNGRQLSSLKEQINNTGFFQAASTPYRVEAAYELHIRTSQKEQHLAYEQDPAYGRAHPSFDRIATLLWQVVTEVEQ
ncbi:MAG TPA: hypothetical protein VJ933_04190 [Phaeodactylibacter sp.]|nr:hypothetical protein [Phaeodactylibacter sp.]